MAESETVFDVDTTFHSARDIQEFMEIFCIENGFKIHKYQYLNKEKEYYRTLTLSILLLSPLPIHNE